MKTCPVCHAVAFDDARICYGCLYRFEEESAEKAGTAGTAEAERGEQPLRRQRGIMDAKGGSAFPSTCGRAGGCGTGEADASAAPAVGRENVRKPADDDEASEPSSNQARLATRDDPPVGDSAQRLALQAEARLQRGRPQVLEMEAAPDGACLSAQGAPLRLDGGGWMLRIEIWGTVPSEADRQIELAIPQRPGGIVCRFEPGGEAAGLPEGSLSVPGRLGARGIPHLAGSSRSVLRRRSNPRRADGFRLQAASAEGFRSKREADAC